MEKIIIIDTETTNDLTDSLVYDCGFIVADYNGTIYSKHSFVKIKNLWKVHTSQKKSQHIGTRLKVVREL